MAEKKPNAALRRIQGIRPSATPTGVTHVRTYQSGQYVVVGNHLAQHRELSLTAIGLATHIFSVPEGTPVDIRSLAERFPEGRERIAAALRELEAYGYLERVREHTAAGQLVTRTYAHHTPASLRPAMSPAALRVAGRPAAAGSRAQGRTTGADVQEASEEDDQAGHPPAPAPDVPAPVREAGPAPVPAAPGAVAPPPAPPREQGPHNRQDRQDRQDREDREDRHGYNTAVALLAGLRRTDSRLTLSLRDVNRLAPSVVDWLDRGVSPAFIRRTLVTGLPGEMNHPAGVLAYRLRELLPPPLPPTPAAAPLVMETGTVGPHRPHPFQTCDGCERAFRSPRPGRCRDCRPAPAGPGGKVACAA